MEVEYGRTFIGHITGLLYQKCRGAVTLWAIFDANIVWRQVCGQVSQLNAKVFVFQILVLVTVLAPEDNVLWDFDFLVFH